MWQLFMGYRLRCVDLLEVLIVVEYQYQMRMHEPVRPVIRVLFFNYLSVFILCNFKQFDND